MLDPIKFTISSLFIAVGQPEYLIRARSIQLAVLIIGLITLGFPLGITGVALAVNFMLVVGVFILLWKARVYVDFSARKLFLIPLIALIVSIALTLVILTFPALPGSDWRTLIIKTISFILIYGSILLIMERKSTFKMIKMIIQKLVPDNWLGKIN